MKKNKLKVKKLRGGGMDMGNAASQATSAAMGNAGVDNQLAAATNYSGLANRSQGTIDALTAQRKGARAAISPSTKTGNRILGVAMNAVIPFSGTLYKKAIDSKAMGYNSLNNKKPPEQQRNDSNPMVCPPGQVMQGGTCVQRLSQGGEFSFNKETQQNYYKDLV